MQLLGDDPIVRAYEQLLCAAYKVSTHICFALSASYSTFNQVGCVLRCIVLRLCGHAAEQCGQWGALSRVHVHPCGGCTTVE